MSYATMARYKSLAERSCQEGRYSDAEFQLLAAVKEAETFPQPNAYLASCLKAASLFYLNFGNNGKAENYLSRCLQLECLLSGPESIEVCELQSLQGWMDYRSRRYEKAEKNLRQVLTALDHLFYSRQHEFNSSLHYFCLHAMAIVLGAQGKRAEAKRLCAEACQKAGNIAGPGGRELRMALHEATMQRCSCTVDDEASRACVWIVNLYIERLQRQYLGSVVSSSPSSIQQNTHFSSRYDHYDETDSYTGDVWRPAVLYRDDCFIQNPQPAPKVDRLLSSLASRRSNL